MIVVSIDEEIVLVYMDREIEVSVKEWKENGKKKQKIVQAIVMNIKHFTFFTFFSMLKGIFLTDKTV